MSDVVIIIPTYWTWPPAQAGRTVSAAFDHPTPHDGHSTLPRLLDSLCSAVSRARPTQTAGPQVIVLTAVAHASLARRAERRVREIIAPYRARLRITQVAERQLGYLRRRMLVLKHPAARGYLRLSTYAGVRNVGLVLAQAAGAEILVSLDDDEVIGPDYLTTALQWVGGERQGERILGVAGPYTQADGGTMLPEAPASGNIFLDKAGVQNESMRALEAAPGRLVRSPVAFGGNVVLHRDLFERVGYDPAITRGEDVDFAVNAQLQGIGFWWDKDMRVSHLPPPGHACLPYVRMAQDVSRFVCEREKLRCAGVDPARFDPYPGRFLRADLEAHALAALNQLATPRGVSEAGSPDEILGRARILALGASPRYAEFAREWPELMNSVRKDGVLREHWWPITAA